MNHKCDISVWGVRGSMPNPSKDCMEYGGNTVCTALEQDSTIIILDAGTGINALGRTLIKRIDIHRIDILLSHLHIDHIMGLFSFSPLFQSNIEIHLYGVTGFTQYLKKLLRPPFWPLGIDDFPARLYFHEISPGDTFTINQFVISTILGIHPGGSILYRLESSEKRLIYALDCEIYEANKLFFKSISDFIYRSDLLIWDTNFTQSDFRPSWGHSTWEQGINLGHQAHVRKILMTHYNWEYTDSFLKQQESLSDQDAFCYFAKEGMKIEL